MSSVASAVHKPDLDCKTNIEGFVRLFYAQMLKDKQLAPIFLKVADIDLDKHLPLISSYWQKLLLGDTAYQRHTMNIHRALHSKQPLTNDDFRRWLQLFNSTLDASFEGPKTDRARLVALQIAKNMQRALPVETSSPS